MILVFIFLGLITITTVIFLVLILSSIRIKVENLRIENSKNNKRYKVFIQIYFLNKIKIFSFKIDNKKIQKLNNSKRFKDIKFKSIKQYISKKNIISALSMLKIQLQELDLKINVGTEEAPLTSYIVAIVSGIISIILPHFVKNKNDKIKYIVTPQYNKNNLNIYLDSIISIKIVHIILMISYLVKKGKNKKERNVIKSGRTSNRGAYAYSHEFN